ncbi:PAS domain S-box protein [Chondrinema litorale]|uniref:PAS domain S-box protein n=1 Tax=Chondrinema litorale TaxID=2994555 RepID=UPI0025428754|nr:PAS domain S-box protein [Chondrinema litorale]UZR93001.1 PAS domain S-box protein [Chondrinema litorale]
MLSWEEQGITDGIDLERLKNCLCNYNADDTFYVWLPESNPVFAVLVKFILLQQNVRQENLNIFVSSTKALEVPKSLPLDFLQFLPESITSDYIDNDGKNLILRSDFFENINFLHHDLPTLLEVAVLDLVIVSESFSYKSDQEKLEALAFMQMASSRQTNIFFLAEDEILDKQCFLKRDKEYPYLFNVTDAEECEFLDVHHYKAIVKINKQLGKSYREKSVELDQLNQTVANYNKKLEKSNEELHKTNKEIADSFTELKKANTVLKHNETFINAVFQIANVGLSIIDVDGNLLRVNREFCNIYSYSEEELINSKVESIIPDSNSCKLIYHSSEKIQNGFASRFTELKSTSDVSKGIKKDGSKIMVLNSTSAVVTEQGEKFYINTVRDITESSRDLHLLHDTLDSLRIGGWEYDIHLKQLFYTDEINNILEVESKSNLSLSTLRKYIYPESLGELQQNFLKIFKEKASFVQEILVQSDKKSIRHLKLTARSVYQGDTFLKLSGTVQDITTIKLEEKKVKESRQLYNALTTNFPGGTIDIINKDYEYVFTGGQELEDLPQNAEDVVGKNIYEIYSKPLAKQLKEHLERCFKGEHVTFDISYQGKYWNAYAIPLSNEDNEVDKVMLLSQNITQQRKADIGLKETHKSLSDFRKALDVASMVAILNEQGEISYINENLSRLSGYKLDEITDKSIDFLFDYSRMVSSFFDEIKELLFAGDIWKGELVGRNKLGNIYWLNMSIIPFVDEKGEPYQFLAVGSDNTTRKLAEEQLKIQNKELTRINGELDRFVYSTSHDLRSPLVSILGLINIARLEIEEGGALSSYLDMIEKSVKKLDGFVQEIIDYSQNARLEVKYEEIDFEEIFATTVAKLQQIDGASQVDFQIETELEVPFYSDISRIAVILNNLITNSIIYRSTRIDNPFVKVRIKANKNFALIEVEDNGKGISEDYIENIFDMFFKATTFSSGSGLGLYIVKESIGILEGEIDVHSMQNEGTTFIVKVPNGARNIDIIS